MRAPTNGPTQFDQRFYKTHDSFSIPSDAQSVRSQATYASGLPPFSLPRGGPGGLGPGSAYSSAYPDFPNGVKRGPPGPASALSQDLLSSQDNDDTRSEAGTERSHLTSGALSSVVAYSQADRMSAAGGGRGGRGVGGPRSTAGTTDGGSEYAGGYKSGFADDDGRSVASLQSSSITDF